MHRNESPYELVDAEPRPSTIADWQALSDTLLSHRCCAFHRNVEISCRYAWLHELRPDYFKWAAMAAIASHHVRLVLFPFRLDTDAMGYVDIPRSLGRGRRLLTHDVNTIRETNNAIFEDIFWVHLAYATAEDGIGRLRSLLAGAPHYGPVLAGFEAIDQARRVWEDEGASPTERRAAEEVVWAGNVILLEHEQRALVQPCFDQLSCTFARIVSLGAATSFEVRRLRYEPMYFTSFTLHSMTRVPRAVRSRELPRITRFEDRWDWLVSSVVPRFRRLDAHRRLTSASIQRIFDDATIQASMPCIGPPLSA